MSIRIQDVSRCICRRVFAGIEHSDQPRRRRRPAEPSRCYFPSHDRTQKSHIFFLRSHCQPSFDFRPCKLKLKLLHFPFLLVALVDLQQVRYLLGHAVATLLIVEIARTDAAFSDPERGTKKSPLIFRSISKALRLIYGTQSLYTFSCALAIAVVYQVAHYVVRAFLELTIFRHELLMPLAHACSSALLCKLHLMWTCATISAHRHRFFSLAGGAEWTHLAVPSFAYGLCEALMYEAQRIIEGSLISSSEDMMQISTSRRAGAEILAVILMLAFRLLGLLPASITLVLTEASLLPSSLETVIPSPTKQRGSTIAELLGRRGKIASGLATFSNALNAFGVPQFLWLIELHLKKCFVQIAIELLALPIVILGIL
jgi:hypothetical protein